MAGSTCWIRIPVVACCSPLHAPTVRRPVPRAPSPFQTCPLRRCLRLLPLKVLSGGMSSKTQASASQAPRFGSSKVRVRDATPRSATRAMPGAMATALSLPTFRWERP
jgi:hypothetical protein